MCTASFVCLIADALLHGDHVAGRGRGEKDSVQGNKQATVATLLNLNLGQYKSQDLRVYSY